MLFSQTVARLPVAVAVLWLIVLHVMVFGYWATRWIGFQTNSFWAWFAVRTSMGFVLLGYAILVMGHLGLLTRNALYLSSLGMCIICFKMYPQWQQWAVAAKQQCIDLLSQDKVLAGGCLITLLTLIVSGLRPQYLHGMVDERDYHWAAPLLWAHAGRWVASPYRLTNGPALMEVLYTFSALFGSVIAAHWTHTTFLLVLLFGCAALAEVVSATPMAAIAVCLSCPVILDQASIAYNDLAAATLVVCAYVALFCGARQELDDSKLAGPTVLIAGCLLAGAVSIKPFTLVSLPIATLYVIWPILSQTIKQAWSKAVRRYGITHNSISISVGAEDTKLRTTPRPNSSRTEALFAAILIVGPVQAALFLWMFHTYLLIGQLWDNNGMYIARVPSDPMWQIGAAAGRIPSLTDIMMLPVVPIVTAIIGEQEPYGGRTGLLLVPFVPIGLYGLRYLSNSVRQNALWIMAAGIVYFFVWGPIAIKTRFHIFVWVTLSIIAALGYTTLLRYSPKWIMRIGVAIFYVLMFTGMFESAPIVLRNINHLP